MVASVLFSWSSLVVLRRLQTPVVLWPYYAGGGVMRRLLANATIAEVGWIVTPCLTLYLTLKLVVPSVPVSSGTLTYATLQKFLGPCAGQECGDLRPWRSWCWCCRAEWGTKGERTVMRIWLQEIIQYKIDSVLGKTYFCISSGLYDCSNTVVHWSLKI